MALRWVVGRVRRCIDALHILVMYGIKTRRNCFRMLVGIGSSSHDFDGATVMTLATLSSVQSWKLLNVAAAGGRNVVAGPWPVSLRTASTFLIKKSRKSWADEMLFGNGLDFDAPRIVSSVFHNFFGCRTLSVSWAFQNAHFFGVKLYDHAFMLYPRKSICRAAGASVFPF